MFASRSAASRLVHNSGPTAVAPNCSSRLRQSEGDSPKQAERMSKQEEARRIADRQPVDHRQTQMTLAEASQPVAFPVSAFRVAQSKVALFPVWRPRLLESSPCRYC